MELKFKNFVLLFLLSFLMGCTSQNDYSELNDWQKIEKSAKNSRVTLCIVDDYKSDFSKFIDTELSKELNNLYNIRVDVVYKSIDDLETYLSFFENTKKGDGIDLIFASPDNLKRLQNKKFLYENFVNKLDNYYKFIDQNNFISTMYDDVFIKQTGIFFNQNILNYYYNDDILYNPPFGVEELLDYVKQNPYKFSYPSVRDELGALFVRNVILNFVPVSNFYNNDLEYDEIKKLVLPAFNYLKKLDKYIYKENGNYINSDDMDRLYAESKLSISFNKKIRYSYEKVNESLYPINSLPFIMFEKNISDPDYMAIPYSSLNKSGAMVVLNVLLSEKIQLLKMKNLDFNGLIPYSVDNVYLENYNSDDFVKAVPKRGVINPILLLKTAESDIPQKYREIINNIWISEFEK